MNLVNFQTLFPNGVSNDHTRTPSSLPLSDDTDRRKGGQTWSKRAAGSNSCPPSKVSGPLHHKHPKTGSPRIPPFLCCIYRPGIYNLSLSTKPQAHNINIYTVNGTLGYQ